MKMCLSWGHHSAPWTTHLQAATAAALERQEHSGNSMRTFANQRPQLCALACMPPVGCTSMAHLPCPAFCTACLACRTLRSRHALQEQLTQDIQHHTLSVNAPSVCFTSCFTSRGTLISPSACCALFSLPCRPPVTSATWATKPLSTLHKKCRQANRQRWGRQLQTLW